MPIAGTGVGNANVRLRIYTLFFLAVFGFSAMLYWKAQLYLSSDYVDLPDHMQTQKHTSKINKKQVPNKNLNYE